MMYKADTLYSKQLSISLRLVLARGGVLGGCTLEEGTL